MIKNFELTIYKKHDIFKNEEFSREFSGASYYFLYYLKKTKIPKCSYIKISVNNDSIPLDFKFTIMSGVLYLSGNHDFDKYINLSRSKKIEYQIDLLLDIFRIIFLRFNLDKFELESLKNVLHREKNLMKIEWKIKDIKDKSKMHLLIIIDIDSFTFYLKICTGDADSVIEIYKSIPLYLAIEFFTTFRIDGNNLKIGSREAAIFEIDILAKKSMIINNNDAVRSLKFS